MTPLEVVGVTKTFGTTRALRDVSLKVEHGEIHALAGGNGSGKSTLVKILAGVLRADPGGKIITPQGAEDADRRTPDMARSSGLHFVHQDGALFTDLTVAENLAIGRGYERGVGRHIRWKVVNTRAKEILERFEIPCGPKTPLAALSPAQRTMVAAARALQDQEGAQSGVLVLDEPTATMSGREVDLLFDTLRRYAAAGQSILFISHRLDEVLSLADTVTVLRNGRNVGSRTTNGLSTADLALMIVGADVAEPPRGRADALGAGVLKLESLSTGPLRDVSFALREGEIVGLAGLVGSGRSHLLRTLAGFHPDYSGTIRIDGTEVRMDGPRSALARGVGYLPEDRATQGVFADMSITSNLSASDLQSYWNLFHLQHRREYQDALASIEHFGIVAGSARDEIATLSGGNQQKVLVARCLRRNPRLLLLDEPSQGVDVGARADIHGIIRSAVDAGAAAVVVSSDFEELIAVSDRILVLRGGTVAQEVVPSETHPATLTHLCYQEDAA